MAISVGTLALEIAVDERKVRTQLRRLDSYANNVARRINNVMGKPMTENQAAKAALEGRRIDAINAKSVATREAQEIKGANNVRVASINAHASSERDKTRLTMRASRQRHALEMAQLRKSAAARAASSGMGGMPGLGMIGLSGTVIGAFAFRGLVTAINDLQTLRQRLMQVADSQEQARMLFDRMADAAGRLRVPVQDATELFVKLRQSNAALGLTYGETQKVTEAFSAALRISGASGQTAASALLQFGQAMAKGRLDGDEFRTVAENASEVLRVLERRFAVSRGEILKWREQGKLTAKMMADALIAEYDNLIDRVNRLPPTLSQAATSFRNSVLMMISDSKDLEEATNRFAIGIVELGNMLKENGPLIRGMAKLALELTAVYAAMKTIQMLGGIPKVLAGAVAGGPLALVALLGAIASSAFLVGRALRDIAQAEQSAAIDEQIQKRADIYNDLQANFRKELKSGKDTAKILKAKALAEEDRRRIIESVTQATLELGRAELSYQQSGSAADGERLQQGKKVYDQRKKLYDLTVGAERLAAAGGGAGGGGVGGTDKAAGGDTKASKERLKTIDDEIRALGLLAEAGVLTEQQKKRLQAIYAEESAALANANNDIYRQTEALGRLNEITTIYGSLLSRTVPEVEAVAKRITVLVAAVDALGASMSRADQRLLIDSLREAESELRRLQAAAAAGLLGDDGLTRLIEQKGKVDELRGAVERLLVALGGEGQEDAPTVADWFEKRLGRELFMQLARAPGDLISEFFTALGSKVDEGGKSVSDRMRGAFGNIFSSIGQTLIDKGVSKLWGLISKGLGWLMGKMGIVTGVFGKIFTKLSALMSNPLFAGPAMIAIGAAMVAFGSALGGAAGGGGGGTSIGGGIGGLGIGGGRGGMAVGTIPNTFTGSNQSPTQGMGGAPAGVQPVVVNATIIGPNDPQAQRQIATLIDNAARRGLMTGGGMRV